MEFAIKSNSSDRELVFSNLEDDGTGSDYFCVELRGSELRAKTRVYAYTDAQYLNAIFQKLGQLDRPWNVAETWKSVDDRFSLAITCNKLGHVLFEITMRIHVLLRKVVGTRRDWPKVDMSYAPHMSAFGGKLTSFNVSPT